jgi:hypothetical protein
MKDLQELINNNNKWGKGEQIKTKLCIHYQIIVKVMTIMIFGFAVEHVG